MMTPAAHEVRACLSWGQPVPVQGHSKVLSLQAEQPVKPTHRFMELLKDPCCPAFEHLEKREASSRSQR